MDGERLECIQDYFGFPEELYKYCYETQNDVELVDKIVSEVENEGLIIEKIKDWGLDHGAWIPLFFMFQNKKVKAVTVSISSASPEHHYKLGEIISRAVSGKKVLFFATGSPTHRLDLFYFKSSWRSRFDEILMDKIVKGRFDEIINIRNLHPKEYISASPEGELKMLYILLGAEKPTKGEVIAYDTPWPGVSMLASYFY